MSLINFSAAVDKAREKKAAHKSLLMPAMISISCDTLIFAYEHLHLVEEQLGTYQQLTADWKAEAKRTQRQIEALLRHTCSSPEEHGEMLKLLVAIK